MADLTEAVREIVKEEVGEFAPVTGEQLLDKLSENPQQVKDLLSQLDVTFDDELPDWDDFQKTEDMEWAVQQAINFDPDDFMKTEDFDPDDFVTTSSFDDQATTYATEALQGMPEERTGRCSLGMAFTRCVEYVVKDLLEGIASDEVQEMFDERIGRRNGEIDVAENEAGLANDAEVAPKFRGVVAKTTLILADEMIDDAEEPRSHDGRRVIGPFDSMAEAGLWANRHNRHGNFGTMWVPVG